MSFFPKSCHRKWENHYEGGSCCCYIGPPPPTPSRWEERLNPTAWAPGEFSFNSSRVVRRRRWRRVDFFFSLQRLSPSCTARHTLGQVSRRGRPAPLSAEAFLGPLLGEMRRQFQRRLDDFEELVNSRVSCGATPPLSCGSGFQWPPKHLFKLCTAALFPPLLSLALVFPEKNFGSGRFRSYCSGVPSAVANVGGKCSYPLLGNQIPLTDLGPVAGQPGSRSSLSEARGSSRQHVDSFGE